VLEYQESPEEGKEKKRNFINGLWERRVTGGRGQAGTRRQFKPLTSRVPRHTSVSMREESKKRKGPVKYGREKRESESRREKTTPTKFESNIISSTPGLHVYTIFGKSRSIKKQGKKRKGRYRQSNALTNRREKTKIASVSPPFSFSPFHSHPFSLPATITGRQKKKKAKTLIRLLASGS